jgi:hypothetical protein
MLSCLSWFLRSPHAADALAGERFFLFPKQLVTVRRNMLIFVRLCPTKTIANHVRGNVVLWGATWLIPLKSEGGR